MPSVVEKKRKTGGMFFATDIANFLACRHTATLDRAESKNEITKPFRKNATVDLLRKLGNEHEQRYLRELAEKGGLAIAQIDVSGGWERAAAETIQALRDGVDAVYQATFLNAPWGGRSDRLPEEFPMKLQYFSIPSLVRRNVVFGPHSSNGRESRPFSG